MSLVTAIRPPPEGFPILVGDLLISGPEQEGVVAPVPTIGLADQVFPQGSGFTINGLIQKVAIVSKSIAVAWAGDVIAARYIVNQLRADPHLPLLSDSATLTYRRVRAIISESKRDLKSLTASLVGFVMVGREVYTFHEEGDAFETRAFGRLMAAGSGVSALRALFQNLAVDAQVDVGAPSSLDTAFSRALSLTAILLNVEIRSNRSLFHYFGGGYELATFLDGRFQKVGDTTYVFWHVLEEDDDVRLSAPCCILSQHYEHDLLVVRAATFEYHASSRRHVLRHASTHGIPPVYRSVTDLERESKHKLPFVSKRVCHCIIAKLTDGSWELNVRVEWTPNGNSKSISVLESPGQLAVEVSRKFCDSIFADVRNLSRAKRQQR